MVRFRRFSSARPLAADSPGALTDGPEGPKAAIEADEVEAVLANIDADRRHLICRFAGHGSCSFCYLHPKSQVRLGARSVHLISGHSSSEK